MGIQLPSGSKGYAFDNAVAESVGSLMARLGMFEDTGALLRTPGGNVENIADQEPVIRWAALNIGIEVQRDPSRWKRQLSLYADAGIRTFPWLHCRTLDDVDFLVSVGTEWGSPAIGLNIEDVNGDKLVLAQVQKHVKSWTRQILMPTLPWVQNGQGWEHLARCVAALEIFPDENDASKVPQDCIDHAFAEGLTKVTLMFKTKAPNLPGQYDLSLCHSLYTADDITPTPQAWKVWDYDGVPAPPKPSQEPSQPGPEREMPAGAARSVNDAWVHMLASPPFKRWQNDNPGEWAAVRSYWAGGAGTDPPIDVKSEFGLSLVALADARRYAEGSHA